MFFQWKLKNQTEEKMKDIKPIKWWSIINSKKDSYFIAFVFIALFLVLIFSSGIAMRLAFVEQRYNVLLNNTTNLVKNLSERLWSLESNEVIKQLTTKVGTLKKDNEILKGQIKSSERELTNISQKERKCQEELALFSGQKKKLAQEKIEKPAKEKKKEGTCFGNRGFLIKHGKPFTSPE